MALVPHTFLSLITVYSASHMHWVIASEMKLNLITLSKVETLFSH